MQAYDDEVLALEICLLAMKTMPVEIKEHLDLSDQAFNDLFMAVEEELNPEETSDPEQTDSKSCAMLEEELNPEETSDPEQTGSKSCAMLDEYGAKYLVMYDKTGYIHK